MTVDSAVPVRGIGSAFEPVGTDVGDRNVLGRVVFSDLGVQPAIADGVPTVIVPMGGGFQEVFTSERPVRTGVDGRLVYAEDGERLFCAARIDRRGVYRDTVRIAYDSAFELITRLGYPQVLRMWNLVGGIIDDNADGLEIYRDFCIGRAEAFDTWAGRVGRIPAATGIGTRGQDVYLYFLAGTPDAEPVHLENPHQTPAYEYPDEYGPKSPSFARATYVDGTLYVSGTASIIGDETVRHGDVLGQTEVTLANIADLIGAENLDRHGVSGGFTLADLDQVKVYVRDAADIPLVKARCEEAFSPDADVVYLNVDVCRPDLLVEIEGIVR
ncbi:pteridine-dependent deoxygenase [Saccharothrix violaceirubra]|uniref:FkbO/Hyg5 family chorismatase n=1 Tax=Saccharothrix violaceirubra TaxID=413306 RepID=A0A7W7T2T0_9PSEU|nr:FkbO/Hyg5 family chorismatase [Saccharothrix violaceirubra]MBB4965560.1 FkbO/Hyg5 family chorismatase [Saccharothrix violaceirubra]